MANGEETNITAGRDPVDAAASPKRVPRSAALSADELVALNEEIAGMAKAGLPLDQGLAVLARELTRGRLQRVTAELAEDLRQGRPLPEAIARQGNRVPPYYAALVTAGIRSGRLGEVLATMSIYARSVADLRSAVVNAFLYPVLIVTMAILIITIMSVFLFPLFVSIYRDFRMRLPAVTEFVLFVIERPLPLIVAPFVLLVLLLLAVRFWLRATERGRLAWARWVYALPLFGSTLRSARLAGFTDLLAILVDHHVPLPEAVRLAGAACSDPLTQASARALERDLSEGRSLSESLRSRRSLPEVVAWMAGIGAQRGTLGSTLHQVAEMYRRQAEMRANLLRTVLPPILIVLSAAVILGLFFVATIMPLYGLLNALSGGFR